MTPLDALWHLLNLFAVPALMALAAASAAKLLWPRRLAGVRWWLLARDAALAVSLAMLAGLVITGREGRMASYAAMVLACAAALWWRGFARR